MKLTKLMLSALAAAVALVACNKFETDVPENTSLKSVKLSFENVIMTKAVAGEKINAGDPVKVSNFKIFLTDGSYSQTYNASTAEGAPATFYFTGETLAEAKTYNYHFVDHKATKVVVVANMGDIELQAVKSYIGKIEDQQDPKTLVLWAEETLERVVGEGSTHEVEGKKYTEVYSASLMLKPVISRFEVDGFVVNFSETPKFNKIEIVDIAFDHYFPQVKFSTASHDFLAEATGEHVKRVADYDSDAAVFDWLNTIDKTGLWYRDHFTTPLEIVPDDKTTADVYENRADTPDPLAYHFFAGNLPPTMIVSVLADGVPSYVYTSRFRSSSDNQILSEIEPGKIYRMNAAGEVGTNGSVPLPDDFDPIQRCLDITVEVVDWTVDIITPEF